MNGELLRRKMDYFKFSIVTNFNFNWYEGKLYSQVLQARETFERPVPQLSDVIVVQ